MLLDPGAVQAEAAAFFAGEHTNSFYEWQGFMEGACLSGIDRHRDELGHRFDGRMAGHFIVRPPSLRTPWSFASFASKLASGSSFSLRASARIKQSLKSAPWER